MPVEPQQKQIMYLPLLRLHFYAALIDIKPDGLLDKTNLISYYIID